MAFINETGTFFSVRCVAMSGCLLSSVASLENGAKPSLRGAEVAGNARGRRGNLGWG